MPASPITIDPNFPHDDRPCRCSPWEKLLCHTIAERRRQEGRLPESLSRLEEAAARFFKAPTAESSILSRADRVSLVDAKLIDSAREDGEWPGAAIVPACKVEDAAKLWSAGVKSRCTGPQPLRGLRDLISVQAIPPVHHRPADLALELALLVTTDAIV